MARIADRLLEPFGIEVKRRVVAGPRRSTLSAALRRLKALGFAPETIIDVGVATGTPPLTDVFPSARHVLIEPLREFTADLERIVAGLPRATYILAAAGAERGRITLHVGDNLFVTSPHRLRGARTTADVCSNGRTEDRAVDVVTLDDVWSERALQAPCLIKIDVEGEELTVLRGAQRALASCEYLILEVAVQDIFDGAPRFETVCARVAELGFVVDDLLEPAYGPHGDLHSVDAAFVPARGWLRNLPRR